MNAKVMTDALAIMDRLTAELNQAVKDREALLEFVTSVAKDRGTPIAKLAQNLVDQVTGKKPEWMREAREASK
jgi:ElaB/YqjD/DUF883 family membrane-anchored ribosome-binding protein